MDTERASDEAEGTIGIAASRDHLVRDGKPFFYVADTIWMAFTHVPEAHWLRYLAKRRAQGFNALQISVLPVLHDLSAGSDLPEPFPSFWAGRPVLGELAPSYARHALERLEAACAHGFLPALVDVWCTYAPDTWASRDAPQYVFGPHALQDYLACVTELFAPYRPLHIVSGDADFESAASIEFYGAALDTVKRRAPSSLTALHLQPNAVLPPVLADSDALDLYVYQSGHHVELADLAYRLAEGYRNRPVMRPTINIEPCYEGHGYGYRYGRFDRRDVRRAWWQGLLAGASAGLAYGAHGVWGWHAAGASFNHAEFSSMPFDRWAALDFPGADEVRFTAWLAESLELYRARPAQHLAPGAPDGVRLAEVPAGGVAVYVPWACELELAVEGPVSVERWDLERRDVERFSVDVGPVCLPLQSFNADALVVLRPEQPR